MELQRLHSKADGQTAFAQATARYYESECFNINFYTMQADAALAGGRIAHAELPSEQLLRHEVRSEGDQIVHNRCFSHAGVMATFYPFEFQETRPRTDETQTTSRLQSEILISGFLAMSFRVLSPG